MAERFANIETIVEFVKKYTPCINGETTMECVEQSIRNAPTIEVVPKELYEQILWERNIAMEQLEEYGIGFASKKKNEVEAKPVAHGKNLSTDNPTRFECSVCGCEDWDTTTCDVDVYKFCPKCGVPID